LLRKKLKKDKNFQCRNYPPRQIGFFLLSLGLPNYTKNNVLAQSNATFLWLAGKLAAVFVDKI